MAVAAVPGLFFCASAAVLLIFVSVSAPVWNNISFLNVGPPGAQIHYGVFGFTGSGRSIGYEFAWGGVGGPTINSTVIHNLTKILILHPIAAAVAGLCVLFGLCGVLHRPGTILMAALAGIATLLTLLIFVIDMALFGTVRNRFRAHDIPAEYGNANWLTLAAVGALMLGMCTGACGSFGSYRRKPRGSY